MKTDSPEKERPIENNCPAWLQADLPRLVSVDVETSGPNPHDFALLSIGACTLVEPRQTFYAELQPTTLRVDQRAMSIHQLDLNRLSKTGLPPHEAMQRFSDWLMKMIPSEMPPLFLGFNAPFDWMFVCDYFHRFLGKNPFGHAALDIKSFCMALRAVPWSETSMAAITEKNLRHNALEDACDQAQIFLRMISNS